MAVRNFLPITVSFHVMITFAKHVRTQIIPKHSTMETEVFYHSICIQMLIIIRCLLNHMHHIQNLLHWRGVKTDKQPIWQAFEEREELGIFI